MELRYIRDVDKREVDFVFFKTVSTFSRVECKLGADLSPHLAYFKERTKIPYFYQVHMGNKDYEVKDGGIRVLSFCIPCVKELDLP